MDFVLETSPPLPQNRTGQSRELLRSAIALTDDLISQAAKTAVEVIGHQGGSATARKLGPGHFRELAALRKTRAGGRPKESSSR